MDLIQEKKELRSSMLDLRNRLDSKRKIVYDLWICKQLEELIDAQGYTVVHTYLPMGKEINILPLIKNLLDKGITVVCPKTMPKPNLENRVLTSLTAIEKGVFGTVHPSNPKEYKGNIDLIIVPGLAFDKDNYRLGYGGGYYDTFLKKYMGSHKIGIFYPQQEVAQVPTEKHDVRLDEILIGRF